MIFDDVINCIDCIGNWFHLCDYGRIKRKYCIVVSCSDIADTHKQDTIVILIQYTKLKLNYSRPKLKK